MRINFLDIERHSVTPSLKTASIPCVSSTNQIPSSFNDSVN